MSHPTISLVLAITSASRSGLSANACSIVNPLRLSAQAPPESRETGRRGVFSRRMTFPMISLCVTTSPLPALNGLALIDECNS
jgi:hypothetical protein